MISCLKNPRKPFLAAFFMVTFNLLPISVFAQSSHQTVEIAPAFVEVVLANEGEEKIIEITFTNNSDQEVILDIFPIDFKQQNEFGTIGFLGQEAGSYSYSLASFLSLESDTLYIGPKQSKVFKVTVKNRLDLSPGGHYAAIVAKVSADKENKLQNQTTVTPSLSSLILLRKSGGERFNLSLVDVSFPSIISISNPQKLTLLFQNEGNVHLVPYGVIELKDIFGRKLSKGIINTSSFKVFPESRRYIPVDLQSQSKSFPISINTITLEGRDSLKKTSFSAAETYLYINPYFALLMITLLLFVLLRIRRRNKLSLQPTTNTFVFKDSKQSKNIGKKAHKRLKKG